MELSQETWKTIKKDAELEWGNISDKVVLGYIDGATVWATKYEAAQKQAEELQAQNIELHDKLQSWINEYRKLENKELQAEVERLREGLKNLRYGMFKDAQTVNDYIESLLHSKINCGCTHNECCPECSL